MLRGEWKRGFFNNQISCVIFSSSVSVTLFKSWFFWSFLFSTFLVVSLFVSRILIDLMFVSVALRRFLSSRSFSFFYSRSLLFWTRSFDIKFLCFPPHSFIAPYFHLLFILSSSLSLSNRTFTSDWSSSVCVFVWSEPGEAADPVVNEQNLWPTALPVSCLLVLFRRWRRSADGHPVSSAQRPLRLRLVSPPVSSSSLCCCWFWKPVRGKSSFSSGCLHADKNS